jgi:hypothetical protein
MNGGGKLDTKTKRKTKYSDGRMRTFFQPSTITGRGRRSQKILLPFNIIFTYHHFYSE